MDTNKSNPVTATQNPSDLPKDVVDSVTQAVSDQIKSNLPDELLASLDLEDTDPPTNEDDVQDGE
ncbi:MAG TPA: hypothetical protein VIE65_12915 [Methylobacter sp.]